MISFTLPAMLRQRSDTNNTGRMPVFGILWHEALDFLGQCFQVP